MSEQSNNIDRYLSDQLTTAEREAFERALRADPALAERVRTQRELEEFFRARNPTLEAELDRLGRRYFTRPAVRRRAGWIAAAVFVLTGLSWWAYRSFRSDAPPAEMERKAPADALSTAPTAFDSSLLETAPPEMIVPSEAETPSSIEPAPAARPPSNPPLAAVDRSPNPYLENLLREHVREAGPRAVWRRPPRDTTLSTGSDRALRVRGYATATPPFEFRLYGNAAADFLEDRRVLSYPLAARTAASDTTRIDTLLALPVEAGLYYWLIVDTAGEEVLGVGRLTVRAPGER